MAIQPSDVQYRYTKCRGRVVVGRVYDDGFLFLMGDPGVWIESNPDIVSSVRSLDLDLSFYKGERIGDSIGELSQLTHLFIWEGRYLKCLPNTLSRLHNLHHLVLNYCDELEDLPPNLGDLYNLTYLSLRPCHSLKLIESVAKLSNLTTLVISRLKELPPNLGGLYNLKSLSLDDCENYVIQSVTKLSNLTTLTICDDGKLEELPANLGDLKFLASLFLYRCYRLRCLPWSITKLSNLRFLHLTDEFRIETLPPHLNDSIIISVANTHIRKTWKELKTQITEFPIITEELAAQKTSTPGYLRFTGDPTLWIRHYNNYGLLSSLRVLDLDLDEDLDLDYLNFFIFKKKIPDSIGELPQLIHLYISNGCLPHHLPPTFSRLTHLSLITCTFECHTISHFDSLGNLSTLTSLHLNLKWDEVEELPKHIDLPISLTHLTLECCYSSIPDSFMASMAKLSNLNTLTLSACGDLESLPLHLNLTKLILRDTTIKSLPIGLKHLEIIYDNRLQDCWENQLVNLETLSYTCSVIESLLSLTSLHNLRELQLKDCFSLKELPQDLHKLVNLCTLDVSGTRIQSLPSSIINLYNLQCLILPKCFILKSLPDDFGNKVMISVDDTDESYYKHQGYHNRGYGIIKDCDYMTSDSIKETNEKFLEKFKQATITIIEQASPHRPSNHQPDATRIIEGSQFNGSTDPTSNNNPNAFISSPNHEIENLPTSNEAGTIPVVVNECYSDVNANTMQDHDPMDIEVGENNSHAHAIFGSRNQETEILKSNNWDGVMTTFVSDIPAEPSFNLQETNSFGENNQQFFQNEHQIVQGMELEQDLEELWVQYLSDDLLQSDHAQPFSGSHFIGSTDPTTNNNPNASITSLNHEIENLLTSNEAGTIPVVVNECHSDVNANKVQDHDPIDIAEDDTDDEDSINSNSTEDVTEIVAGSRQEAIIEQASPHRPLNHPPDEIQILEDPTSNDSPNAFISSPNHEIKNLPTSNEAGTIPFVVDVSANTMPGHAPMEIEDKSNFPYHIKIPSAIMDYLVGYKDVEADGNCGFRCVAEVFHGGQEKWFEARRAILDELKAHPNVYQKIYFDDYISALQRIDWDDGKCGEDHYMKIVEDLFPIANFYQCIVMCFFVTVDELNPQLSATVLPWNIGAHSARPTKELSIAHLGERYMHYILLDLKDDFPVPPILRLWYDIIGKTTVDWVSRYEERRNRWDQLTNRSRDSTHLVIRDDCNVNGGNSVVGENISHGHASFNKGIEIQTLNSSRKGVVVTSVNLELAIGTASAPALCKSQNSVKGGRNNHALVIGQHKKSQTGDGKCNNQKIEISRESINRLMSLGLTVEKAAKQFKVSRSTLKRRLREYEIKWPSGKKSKILDTNRKKRQHKESGRNLSQTNSVDPSNPTRQGQMELAGPSQLALSTLATLGQGMEHPIGQKHPTLSDIETIDSKDADPQQLEEIISQFGYIIINKSTEFHTYGHQRVEEPLNGDKAGRNLSGSQLMNNLVDPSNPTSHGQGMEHLAEPSQPALSNNPASHGQGVEHPNRQKEPTLSVLSGSTIDSKDVDRQDYEKLKKQLEDLIKPTECHQRVEEQLNIDKDKAGRNLPGSQLMINLVNPSNPTSHGQGMEHLAEPSQPALFNRAIHGQGVEHLGGPSQPALFNPASHGQGVEHIAGSSQPTLSYHVPSEHNVVNNSTHDVVTTTVGEPPLSTQYCMDSHQHVEEHNGANEPAMVNTDLLPNESSSTFVVKATFNEDTAKFNFSLSSSIEELKDVVRKKLELEIGTFKIKYKDIDNDLVLMNDTSNLEEAVSLSRKSGSNVVRLSIFLKT